MRWAILACVMLLVGCNAMVTEDQARETCTSVGVSSDDFDAAVDLAEQDEMDGLSAAESRNLFSGDCEDSCGDDNQCFSDCRTCTNAVVSFVYSN